MHPHLPKLIKLYILNMHNILYVSHTSIKWLKRKPNLTDVRLLNEDSVVVGEGVVRGLYAARASHNMRILGQLWRTGRYHVSSARTWFRALLSGLELAAWPGRAAGTPRGNCCFHAASLETPLVKRKKAAEPMVKPFRGSLSRPKCITSAGLRKPPVMKWKQSYQRRERSSF